MPASSERTMLTRPSARLATAEPWLGANFWSRVGGPLMWREYDDRVVRAELAVLAAHGVRLTRSFFYWPDFHPAPDTIDERYVANYRRFLDACCDLGMTTIPTFIVGHMSGANWDVPWRNGRSLYTDGFMLGQQTFFIREMVRRVGSSPAVAGWLISNEMPLYGGRADRREIRAWGLICAAAVRAGGSDLPVSLGDGAWTKEVTGRESGFRLRDQLDVVDFFGPHSYPAGNDQIRQFSEAAFACELAHLGKPVILEEFGVTSAFVDDEQAGHYYRQVLHRSLLAGATGWIAWNNTDFDLSAQDPYRHNPFELGFGLTTVDGTPKSTLTELAAFRRVLDAVDFARCERVPTGTAVLLPANVDLDLELFPADEREVAPVVTMHAWIAATAAGLAPAVVRESVGVPLADLVIVPSNKALLATTPPALCEAAAGGSHVYVSWFAGVGVSQRGAWWPPLEPVFGARHTLRYGITEPVDDEVVEWTLVEDLGDLPAGATLSFGVAGHPNGRAYLPLEPTTARVVAVDQHGRPALLRRDVGAGAVYLGACPIEYFGSARRDAHADDQVWRLYRALAVAAGITPAVTVETAGVVVDQLRHADGSTYTWLVSSRAEETTVRLVPADGARLVDVLDGTEATDGCTLPPFGVRVLRHVTVGG